MGMFDDLIPGQQPQGSGMFDDLIPQKDPKIGRPEELTFAEKYLAPLLDKAGAALQSDPGEVGSVARAVLNNGNLRGSAIGGAMQGAADPGVAIAQIIGNAAGQGPAVNQAIRDKEAEYQAARKEGGRSGFDASRFGGNAAMMTFMAGAMPPIVPGAPAIIRGALQGGAAGALEPVTSGDDFFTEKGKQVGTGAAVGGALSPLASALARVISPNASTNASLQLLRNEGVEPTLGQSLGGAFNAAEEKASSLPIVGDVIRGARGRALEQFNEAALNRITDPLGGKVTGAGFDAYGRAKQAVSGAYDDALNSITHVNFATPTMVQKLGQLEQMAQTGLPDNLARQFTNFLDENVAKRLSSNGSMLPEFYKKLDSELGQKAAQYGRSSVASEQDFGRAVKQLQQLFRDEVATQNPGFSQALRAADAAYSQSVPVRDAVARAVNNDGVFTPGQLNYAIRKTSGPQATTGSARMQDLARAAQNVIGNKIPNSGTVDRGALVAALLNPLAYVPAAAVAAGAYTRPVQNALRAMVASRPQQAPEVANYLRRILPQLAPAEVAALQNRER